MTVRIVTDSSADLPAELVQQHQITVLPCYVVVDDAYSLGLGRLLRTAVGIAGAWQQRVQHALLGGFGGEAGGGEYPSSICPSAASGNTAQGLLPATGRPACRNPEARHKARFSSTKSKWRFPAGSGPVSPSRVRPGFRHRAGIPPPCSGSRPVPASAQQAQGTPQRTQRAQRTQRNKSN